MIKSDDLLLMSFLAQESSIAAVGRRMFLTPSAISQRLSALENKLGQELALRNGRSGIVLTADGEFLAEKGREIIGQLDLIEDQINDRKGIISGPISVIAPFGFGRHYIAPSLEALSRIYPKLSFDLRLTDDLNYIPEFAWDILIRISPSKNSQNVGQEISKNRRIVCASPAYLERYGQPVEPEDLIDHKCISISEDGFRGADWHFYNRNGVAKTVKITPYLNTNDGEAALTWAKNGLGVIVRSQWSASPLIKTGELIELLPGWSAPDAPIMVLAGKRSAGSARVKMVMDYLTETIKI